MPYSSYPRIVNPDYSPPQDIMSYQEPFDKDYLADSYTTSPDYSLSTFFDTDSFFDRPLANGETSAQGFPSRPSPNFFNPTLSAAGVANSAAQQPSIQATVPTSFGQLPQYPPNFSFDPTAINPAEQATFSPATYASSRTPSLCGDAQPQAASPVDSPRNIKRESPSSPTSPVEDTTPKRPQRKRGRPRLDRTHSDERSFGSSSSAKCQRTGRLPHNQVERKYREGLNSELERLRRAVPTLPQSDEGGVMGQPKPSKAMVLAGAIEYIRKIEKERDELKEENSRLRSRRNTEPELKSWKTGNSSLDDFLMDP